MMKTMMKTTTMKTTNRLAALALLAGLCGSAGASELTDAANADWLELVRRYTSADTLTQAEDSYRWSRLVQDSSAHSNSFLAEWWKMLGDDTLTALIDSAFESNRDFRSARAKVLEARAQLGVTASATRPRAEGRAEYTHGRNSDAEDPDLKSYNKYALGIDASWELDLFGRSRHNIDAAKADLEAEYATLHDGWVSLSAEVAVNYITLRTLQNRLESLRKNAELQAEILEMLESKYNAGMTDALAVQQERYTLEHTRSEIPALEQSIQETMNALAVLTGQVPGSLNARLSEVAALPRAEDSRLIGIPAETLRQRPDVRAAERRLAAQISTRKAAEKAAYPTIALIGSIGLESLSTGDMFSSGGYGFTIGPRITWPIFNGGEIRKNIAVQSAVEEQLAAELEGVILRAVGEVRDALSANVQELVRNERLKSGLTAARDALSIAREKYARGLVGFGDVLSSQQAVYRAEDECIASDGQKVINMVRLFKSLGGGWLKME